MSHSIETRSPFLDYNFVEKVLFYLWKENIGIRSKYIIREHLSQLYQKKFTSEILKLVFCPGELWTKKNRNILKKF